MLREYGPERLGGEVSKSECSAVGLAASSTRRAAIPWSGTTPAHLRDHEIRVEVEHDDFNPRTMLADGTLILPDLRRILYGDLARG